MSLERRPFLSGIAASAIPIAGCLSRGQPGAGGSPTDEEEPTDETETTSPDDEDSVPELTGYVVSDHAVTPSAERYSDMDPWGLFLASRERADRYFEDVTESDVEQVQEFIDETSFADGDRLLYLHAFGPQTCYELTLAGAPEIAEDGHVHVKATVDRTAPEDDPCGDAVTPVRLLCRLSFDLDAGTPDAVNAQIDGHWDDSKELLIESER